MIVNIPPHKTDDPAFLTALNGMLANIVDAHRPCEVHFIRIDRWFDHKWLGYSGNAKVGLMGNPFADTAHEPKWRNKLTFPPFAPNRVIEQISFKRGDGSYRRDDMAQIIHNRLLSRSEKNMQNRVTEFTTSGLFVWFSSQSASNERASVMSYSVAETITQAWFVSLLKRDDQWSVHQTNGIDRDTAVSWFPPGNVPRRV